MQAGNHGDEWEGQIGLGNLIRALEPKDIKGRLVILPSANFPAAMAGQRTSPIDDGNLNRSFPGDRRGHHHAADRLLDRARAAAGLRLRLRLPFRRQLAHLHPERAGAAARRPRAHEEGHGPAEGLRRAGELRLGRAAGRRPHLHLGLATARACCRMGTELGGGGLVTPALAQGRRGRHAPRARPCRPAAGRRRRRRRRPASPRSAATTTTSTLPTAACSSRWSTSATRSRPASRPPASTSTTRRGANPRCSTFKRDGLVLCKRVPARCERGDCLFHLATDIAG